MHPLISESMQPLCMFTESINCAQDEGGEDDGEDDDPTLEEIIALGGDADDFEFLKQGSL